MGIADAIIDKGILASGNNIGGFYALAPENANGRNIDTIIANTDYLWQYGTAEVGSPSPNELHHQDGVAPQVAIPGLSYNSSDLTKGRIKYGGELSSLGFGKHHLGENYEWIIEKLKSENDGFVQPRN